MDPCGKCGATILAGSDECRVCGAPVVRQTTEQRAAMRRGPRIAASLTLAGLGAIFVIAGIAVMGGTDDYGPPRSYRRYRYRGPIALVVLGRACLGAAARTYMDE